MQTTTNASVFYDRIMFVFGSRVFGAAVGVINGFILARLLGPAAKGDYALLILVPPTAMVVIQLGLPQAFGFFAARSQTVRMVTKAAVLTVLLSAMAFLVLALIMPFLRAEIYHQIPLALIALSLVGLPLTLNSTFTTGIVTGRQAMRSYAAVSVFYPLITTVMLLLLLGVLDLGVEGAIIVFLVGLAIQMVGFLIAAVRVTRDVTDPQPISYRALFRYGLPMYPGSVTQFFSYRADVYLIAALIASPAEQLGYYSMAVGFAELVFFLPNAVSTVFFPYVSGASKDESTKHVAFVTRITLVLTACSALVLAPLASIFIILLLPAFTPSLPALFVLLPGVVALSSTKVATGYVSGLGMTAITSYINIGALVVNILLNILLIPMFGIVGAAAASLISYTASSVVFTILSARIADGRLRDFWLIRASDLRFVWDTTWSLARRMLRVVWARA